MDGLAAFNNMTLQPKRLIKLETVEEYTEEELKERLQYVKDLLDESEGQPKRDITPKSRTFLVSYQRNIVKYFDESTQNVKEQCILELMEYDIRIKWNEETLEKQSAERTEMTRKMVQLQRHEYYSRYGDYFGEQLSILRVAARSFNIQNASNLKRYWTEIAKTIKIQRTVYEAHLRPKGNTETWQAVMDTCTQLEVDEDHMYTCIMAYAERNALVHGTAKELLQQGRFHDLAEVLHADECALKDITLSGKKDEVIALRSIIQTMRDKWFVIPDLMEDDPQCWQLSDEALESRRQKGPGLIESESIVDEACRIYLQSKERANEDAAALERLQNRILQAEREPEKISEEERVKL